LTGRSPGRSSIPGSQKAIEGRAAWRLPAPGVPGVERGWPGRPAAQLARDRQRLSWLCAAEPCRQHGDRVPAAPGASADAHASGSSAGRERAIGGAVQGLTPPPARDPGPGVRLRFTRARSVRTSGQSSPWPRHAVPRGHLDIGRLSAGRAQGLRRSAGRREGPQRLALRLWREDRCRDFAAELDLYYVPTRYPNGVEEQSQAPAVGSRMGTGTSQSKRLEC